MPLFVKDNALLVASNRLAVDANCCSCDCIDDLQLPACVGGIAGLLAKDVVVTKTSGGDSVQQGTYSYSCHILASSFFCRINWVSPDGTDSFMIQFVTADGEPDQSNFGQNWSPGICSGGSASSTHFWNATSFENFVCHGAAISLSYIPLLGGGVYSVTMV